MITFRNWLENKDKVMILMRGVSGSGKSTIAKQLGGVIFSTDDFFVQNGKYNFDKSKIIEAHLSNQAKTEDAMRRGISPIIIDNTNTARWQMKPYVSLADKYGYQVEIKEMGVNFPEANFEELLSRQALRAGEGKSISPEIVQSMLAKFERNVSVDDIRKFSNEETK